jgi:hypothetical protein
MEQPEYNAGVILGEKSVSERCKITFKGI